MKFVVARTDEIAPGERKIVEVAGRSIGVFNLDGEYFALRNYCPHQGGALCEGQLWGVLEAERPGEYAYSGRGEVLACPWHGWEFHVRTGQSWCAPETLAVRRYDVEVVGGPAAAQERAGPGPGDPPAPGMVPGPYVAETYRVEVDGEVLVVDVPSAGRSGAAP